MVAHSPKLVTLVTIAFALVSSSISQGTPTLAPDVTVARAFGHAMEGETGRHLKRIYKKRVEALCATDARRWGDGILGFYRITFLNEQELTSKMQALTHQLKTVGSQDPAFDASDFPRLRRYAVGYCGTAGGQTTVVIAVYRSAWDTYWENWASLLGK
jgi:hypothetical protein